MSNGILCSVTKAIIIMPQAVSRITGRMKDGRGRKGEVEREMGEKNIKMRKIKRRYFVQTRIICVKD